MRIYEILLLGDHGRVETELVATLRRMTAEYGLDPDELAIRQASDAANRSRRAATVGVFVGGAAQADATLLTELLSEGVPVLPTIDADQRFETDVPGELRAINGLTRRGDDPKHAALATAVLECLGLLHRQRRAFVSYRRTEAEPAAVQIFNELSARGFTVFLDTHSIRPGLVFQEELWHQMCDCDVVLMLDTATYFNGRWTREEIAKARGKELQVLRVIWPGIKPAKMGELSETVYLSAADLQAPHGPIDPARLDAIATSVEWLRSRSVASRHRSMSDRLRADLERIGGTFHGVGAHRAMSLELLSGKRVWAYPVVGVPTAETVYDIHTKARLQGSSASPVLVYDDIGLRDGWLAHLDWLGEQIPAVRWVRINKAWWTLAEMGEMED